MNFSTRPTTKFNSIDVPSAVIRARALRAAVLTARFRRFQARFTAAKHVALAPLETEAQM